MFPTLDTDTYKHTHTHTHTHTEREREKIERFRETMLNAKSIAVKEAKIAELQKRLTDASKALEIALKGDNDLISSLEKKEEHYHILVQDLKESSFESYRRVPEVLGKILEKDDHGNVGKDKSTISSESILFPRQLFPERDESSSSIESSIASNKHRSFVRKVTTLREEKLRKIMGDMKASMQRRESF
jgi:hypothetical protein